MGAVDWQARCRCVTYYFDASVQSAVPLALALVRNDIRCAGQPGLPGRNWPDEQWLHFAAERGWTVIMRDKRVRRRPGEREALRTTGLGGAFILTGAGNYTKWEVLELLVSRWGGIEEAVATLDRPFVCSVTRARVVPLG